MKEKLKRNAGIIGVITTAFFACLVWAYASKGYSYDPTNLVIAGAALVILDTLTLWSFSKTKVIRKKKGKK